MKKNISLKGCLTAEIDQEAQQINFSEYGENLLSLSMKHLNTVHASVSKEITQETAKEMLEALTLLLNGVPVSLKNDWLYGECEAAKEAIQKAENELKA